MAAGSGRFEPTAEKVAWANQRAEALAGRIVRARRLLLNGARPEEVVAVLDGARAEEFLTGGQS